MYKHYIRTPAKTERKNIIINNIYICIGAIIQYITYIIVVSRYLRCALGEIYTCPINNYNIVTTIYTYHIGPMCVGCDLRIIFVFRVLIILMTAVSPPPHPFLAITPDKRPRDGLLSVTTYTSLVFHTFI